MERKEKLKTKWRHWKPGWHESVVPHCQGAFRDRAGSKFQEGDVGHERASAWTYNAHKLRLSDGGDAPSLKVVRPVGPTPGQASHIRTATRNN